MTITFPVVAPTGTVVTMVVLFQLVVVAVVPLNLTLFPEAVPNVVPVIVTDAPTAPEVIDKLVMWGITVKLFPLLATPDTVTTTFPVVAAFGTDVTMAVLFQLVVVAVVPLNFTLFPEDVPKLVPVIVTEVPAGPEVTERLVMLGPAA